MSTPFVEDVFFFSLYIFGFFAKSQLFIGVCMNVRDVDSIPLILVSAFMSMPSCFYYYRSIVELEVRAGNTFRSSDIAQDCVNTFLSHEKLIIVLLKSVKIVLGF